MSFVIGSSASPSASYSPSASASPTPSPTPSPILQENYVFQLLVGGTNYWPYLLRGGLTIVQVERAEVGTLSAVLEDYDGSLDFTTALWSEVYFQTTDGYKLFGGYLVAAVPEHSKAEDRAIWTLKCESWSTVLARALPIRQTWANKTCGYIAADLFTTAGLTSFDTSTYVTAGDTLESFEATGQKLCELLDELAQRAHAGAEPFVWWITPEKELRFGLAATFAAPFGIAPLTSADWYTTFPPLRSGSNAGREYVKDEYDPPPTPAEDDGPSNDYDDGGHDRGGQIPAPSQKPIKWY